MDSPSGSPRWLMRPAAFTTRCQGTADPSGNVRNAYPTRRACRGMPASFAICPYVATRPRGMRLTIRWMELFVVFIIESTFFHVSRLSHCCFYEHKHVCFRCTGIDAPAESSDRGSARPVADPFEYHLEERQAD